MKLHNEDNTLAKYILQNNKLNYIQIDNTIKKQPPQKKADSNLRSFVKRVVNLF